MRTNCLLLIFFIAFSATAQDTTQQIIPGRKNNPEQQKKPYVILISADGFRYDYATKHGAPNVLSLSKHGVRAEYMIPSFPSLTFPNHYSIATGMYPSHHGLVDNQFYESTSGEGYTMSKADKVRNPKWYGGTPLWVLAEKQGMLSASFYWVGTEAPIGGVLPTYYYYYNTKISIDQRIQQVVNWLQLPEDIRPHFISFYFPEVDHEGHTYGPGSDHTKEAVHFVDSAIGKLNEAVKKTGLDVNFIFVADHGMTQVDTLRPLTLPTIDTTKATMSWGGEFVQIYVKNKNDVASMYQELKQGANGYAVVLKDSMPEHLHYGTKDDVMGRMGDIYLMANAPRVFTNNGRKPKSGAHGFDPFFVKDMEAIFYAWGPAFKKGKVMTPFSNVNVYPVVTTILGLKYNTKDIDGNNKLAQEILK